MDEDGFHSITWDDAPPRTGFADMSSVGMDDDDDDDGFDKISPTSPPAHDAYAAASGSTATVRPHAGLEHEQIDPANYSWEGRWMAIDVKEPVKEHEGSKDMYVSYAVQTKTNVPTFKDQSPIVRRRFQDFVFLHDQLQKSFPACVIPPIPDKHRLEYIKGDRFSSEFVEKRRLDLQRFVDRIASHPTLQRSQIVIDFLTTEEWTVVKHKHIANPPPESHSSLMDSLSDGLVNMFTRVRKPDARFVDMNDGLERFEDGLGQVERLVARSKNRVDDYQDMAAAYQGLGYLESGITEPLNRFAEKMLDFSTLLKHQNQASVEPFLQQTHSLLQYSGAHRATIKLRDQKQLDFEELSAYLSAVAGERDRLAALSSGHTGAPVGLGTYLRDQVDKLRGTDDIHTRRERMRKLDGRIKELQEAVTTAHETSDAFSDEVLKEHAVFELNKQQEMKEMLGRYADGQVEMLQRAMDDWDRIIPLLQRIRVDV
ncbi:intercellular trafficking and secretion [Apiotrichum porosum]|uniref:Sorting nexin-4 n=1 Tax=Apiotrichum porosum TaxID=105984 RepID=A0A427Y6K2_9TREE|nr:intercellular trafficking and secretion [Apiotrichum porosum]RSH86720.1 intercellular trafficking and secretion [Apiotrichum porosum]